MIRIAFIAIVLLTLTACQPDSEISNSDDSVPGNLTLELYSTGDTSAQRVAFALDQLLDGFLGQARALRNGQIAVAAPASIQSGVARVIEQLAEAGEPEIRRIRVRQWLIEGNPAGQTKIPDELAALAGPLEATTASVGNLGFRLLDRSEHVMLENTKSTIRGKLLDTNINARATADRIQLDLNIETSLLGGVRAEIGLDPGEHIVMAQIERPLGDEDHADSIVVFVVQADFI